MCVLHYPHTNVESQPFLRRLKEKMESGDYVFRGTVFREPLNLPDRELSEADFSEAVFTQPADFSGARFVDKVRFAGAKFNFDADFHAAQFCGPVSFSGSSFCTTVDFRSASFEDATSFVAAEFKGDAIFRHARFSNMATFGSAVFQRLSDLRSVVFRQGASFKRTVFGQDVTFNGTIFNGLCAEDDGVVGTVRSAACFLDANFKGPAEFRLITFHSGACFKRAVFFGQVVFLGTRFLGNCTLEKPDGHVIRLAAADFRDARFGEGAFFETLLVKGPLNFRCAQFSSAAYWRGPFFLPEDWKKVASDSSARATVETAPRIRFESVFLEKPSEVRFDRMKLGRTRFAGTNVRGVQFHNVTWAKTVWFQRLVATAPRSGEKVRSTASGHRLAPLFAEIKKGIGEHCWRKLVTFFGHSTTADELQPEHRGRARRVFRDLKANLEDQRDYPDAGDFYYAEMEIRRRQSDWIRKVLLWVYWVVCGYGEKPLRALEAIS